MGKWVQRGIAIMYMVVGAILLIAGVVGHILSKMVLSGVIVVEALGLFIIVLAVLLWRE